MYIKKNHYIVLNVAMLMVCLFYCYHCAQVLEDIVLFQYCIALVMEIMYM